MKKPSRTNPELIEENALLKQRIKELEQSEAERTREEEKRNLNERLQRADKMEAIGTLAGGIAHDFNNLLMGIQGYASLTLMDLAPSHPHYERLKRIEEHVQNGADLTKQLLGFAHGGRYEVTEETATGIIARGMETILLVDDEKMILEVSKAMLESMGYRVYAAGSGQEAVAVYMEKQKEIDLVILDMIMPGIGISGGETFDRLREINPGIKVLLSSGYSIHGKAQTIIDRGCNGFIQKPFSLEKLSRKIREMID
jgi:CheY-like chemotaxis protein